MTDLSFVAMLPLKIAGAHYDENIERMRLLLDSFERFLDLPAPLPVYAICLPAELAAARAAFGGYDRVELRFVAEQEIIAGITEHRAIGWYKQQVLKLAFGASAPAPFYLTLDPDILLCRRLRETDLVAGERCYTSWMSRTEHPHWWAASAEILGMTADPARPGLNVTPQMLSASIARELGRHLRARLAADSGSPERPWLALLERGTSWTEYTLYSIFAEASGMLDAFHRSDLPGGRRLLGRSVWTPANFENYSLAAIHEAADGAFFTVCASHTFVPAATLRKMFDEMLDRIAA